MRRRLAGLLAAVLMGTAAGAVLMVQPAAAAACTKGTGVSVVVGSSVGCDANGAGKYAIANLKALHSVEFVQKQPGFVCRIDGYPNVECVNTPPASAYWALWWSDGTSGWKYSSRGAGSLKVPAGGFVGFVFGNGKAEPGVAPVGVAPPKPKPAPKPKPKPSAGASVTPTPSASASASASEKPKKSPKPSATPSASATPSGPVDEETINTSAETEHGGTAWTEWIAVALAALLIAGMGVAAWRRRAAGQP